MVSRTCLVEHSISALLAVVSSFAVVACSARGNDAATSDVPSAGSAARDDADEMIRAAYAKLEQAGSVEIQESEEQTSRATNAGQPLGAPQSTTQRSTIELDNEQGIVRLAMNDPTRGDVIVLRCHDRVAVKSGSDDWGPPEGPFAALGKQLANPMACPAFAEDEAPAWRTVGVSILDGRAVTLVETVGDSAVAYVQRVQEEGIASAFPDGATRPRVSIVAYSMRAWIDKEGGTLVRQEKTLEGRLAFPGTVEVEFTSHSVQDYRRYGEVELTIPDAASRILVPEPEQRTERP